MKKMMIILFILLSNLLIHSNEKIKLVDNTNISFLIKGNNNNYFKAHITQSRNVGIGLFIPGCILFSIGVPFSGILLSGFFGSPFFLYFILLTFLLSFTIILAIAGMALIIAGASIWGYYQNLINIAGSNNIALIIEDDCSIALHIKI